MKILLSSSENEILESIGQLILANRHELTETGESKPSRVAEMAAEYDYIILNQTTTVNRRIISGIENREKVIEFSMAKAPISQFSNQIISLGMIPEAGEQPRKTVSIITDICREDYDEAVQEIFSGANFITQESSGFDTQVSELLVKPYIMSLLARKVSDLDFIPRTKEYEKVLDLSRAVTNYNVDYMRDLLRNNPHTGEIFGKMEENLKRVWNELSFY